MTKSKGLFKKGKLILATALALIIMGAICFSSASAYYQSYSFSNFVVGQMISGDIMHWDTNRTLSQYTNSHWIERCVYGKTYATFNVTCYSGNYGFPTRTVTFYEDRPYPQSVTWLNVPRGNVYATYEGNLGSGFYSHGNVIGVA